jgi:hypothetical protein
MSFPSIFHFPQVFHRMGFEQVEQLAAGLQNPRPKQGFGKDQGIAGAIEKYGATEYAFIFARRIRSGRRRCQIDAGRADGFSR